MLDGSEENDVPSRGTNAANSFGGLMGRPIVLDSAVVAAISFGY